MKVAWFDAEEWHEGEIDSEHQIEFFENPLDLSLLDSSFDAISVRSRSRVSSDVLEKVRPQKVLCRSSGHDNVDLAAANELGVAVQNTPGYGTESVAEYNLALILDAAKQIDQDSGLNPNNGQGSTGLELKDSILGVVGAGRIGRELLKRAKALGMELIAYDPYEDSEAAEEIGYEYVEFEELLRKSDVVSVNCPLTESTRNLISGKEFELMDQVVFVNIARGEIVDTSALVEALETDSVNTAALDVVEEGKFGQVADREDVLVTPHNAYNTEKAKRRRIEITLNNLDNEENIVSET